jgi:serine/threonine-protein kinase
VVPPSVRLNSDVSPVLQNLVLACLEKDPAHRPENAAALLASLDACTDVPPWTSDDARRWWSEHGGALRASSDARGDALPQRTKLDVAIDRAVPV